MQSRGIAFPRLVLGAGCVLALAMFAGAQSPDSITVIVGQGLSNTGDSVEIPVTLDSGGAAPSTMVLFIAYDPLQLAPYMDFYEHVRTGFDGQILYDEQGNALTEPSPVMLSDALAALGVNMQSEVHAQGVIGIIILETTAVLPDGPLFKMAFKVLSGAAGEELLLDGISTQSPILIGGEAASSSASTNGAEGLDVMMLDGKVLIGCSPAQTPGNVVASQGRPDAVEVTWNAVATPNAQYRVFRSNSNDPATASPLGNGWQTATSFVDFSAKAPVLVSESGCCRPAVYRESRHYYWVKARTQTGCESAFSTPAAEGYRGNANKAAGADKTVAAVFPAGLAGPAELLASAGDTLVVWLASDEEIEPASVWAQIETEGEQVDHVEWIPASEMEAKGGWLRVPAPGRWPENGRVVLRAGAETLSGVPLGPRVREFRIRQTSEVSARPAAGFRLEELPSGLVPELAEGVGPLFRVGPDSLFETPQRFWLPVPEGIRPDDLTLYYFSSDAGDFRWFPGDRVEGWLAPGVERIRRGNVAYLGFYVHHGGVVQLGYAPGKGAVAIAPAMIVPGWFMKGHSELLLMIGMLAGLCILLSFNCPAWLYKPKSN